MGAGLVLSLGSGLVFPAVACARAFVLSLCILTGPLGAEGWWWGATTVPWDLHFNLLTHRQEGIPFTCLQTFRGFLVSVPSYLQSDEASVYSDPSPVPRLGSMIVTQAESYRA